jgi:hypothetical protein
MWWGWARSVGISLLASAFFRLRDDPGDCKQFLLPRTPLDLSACPDEQKIKLFSSKCQSAESGIPSFNRWRYFTDEEICHEAD